MGTSIGVSVQYVQACSYINTTCKALSSRCGCLLSRKAIHCYFLSHPQHTDNDMAQSTFDAKDTRANTTVDANNTVASIAA